MGRRKKSRLRRKEGRVVGPGDPNRFTLEATGETFAVDGRVDFKCPFCAGSVIVSDNPRAVMHTMPYCKKFDEEDPLVFLRNARVAVAGSLPDDGDFPVATPSSGSRGDN